MKVNSFQKSYQNWNCFSQAVPVKSSCKIFFRLQASVKVIQKSEQSFAKLWVRLENSNSETVFFYKSDKPIQSNEWKTYTIDGEINQTAKKLFFGGLCELNGEFYFKNFELYIQANETELEQVNIKNPNFKGITGQLAMVGWQQGNGKNKPVKVNNYSFKTKKNERLTDSSLKITGENMFDSQAYSKEVLCDTSNNIVTALQTLTNNIINTLGDLTIEQIDYSINGFENSIGSLLIHTTAIEAFYQIHTFEERKFNEGEEKQWKIAMSLNKEAQKKYKNFHINYYVEEHLKIRQTTLQLFKNVDEKWLKRSPLNILFNNHQHWIHVIEHYSYHLGQINMLKKIIIKKNNL